MERKRARQRRSQRRAKRKVHAPEGFNRFLRATLARLLTGHFHVRAENRELLKNLKPPYLLLANHISVLDPFFVGRFVPGIIHYVVSDANFRNPVVNFGLSLVGSIPKTKAMSDMDTIRNIMRVTKQGGIVGIFPEGQSSWDGASLPIVYATAKLIKVLKIPVVIAKLTGSFLTKPRWARRSRRGRIVVRYELAFTTGQLKAATVGEVDARVRSLLSHNEFQENRVRRQRFVGRERAEYMEIALFLCPSCESLGTLHSHGNVLRCESCGYAVRVDLYGFFASHRGELQFDTMHQWNVWQKEVFRKQLSAYGSSSEETPFMFEDSVDIQKGFQDQPLEPLLSGSIALYRDRIEAEEPGGRQRTFPLSAIQGANIQNKERLEFYVDDTLYRVVTRDPRGCTYKWDLAIRHMQENHGKES